jgi:alpha-L-fucosidase
VSRGGNLLINVGPTAAGDVPWPQAERMLALGWWLAYNGGAIYGTRPWVRHQGISGDGIPVRYTSSEQAVYATVLGRPPTTEVELDLRLAPEGRVLLEGQQGDLTWTHSPGGTRVTLPEPLDRGPATAFRLEPAAAVEPLGE